MTDLDRNSKADTVFLSKRGDGGSDDLSLDISQERTDITFAGTYVHESPSARAAITYPRELSVTFAAQTGDAGILLNHGNAAGTSYTYRMRVNAGALECMENGTLRVSVALPSLILGGAQDYVAHWSTFAIGTSVRSEVMVHCVDTGVFAHGFATHAAPTTNASWDLTIGGYGAGVSAYDVDAIDSVRISQRFHSLTEGREDWITQSTKPTITARLRNPTLPVDTDTLIGLEGGFAGPAYLWAGAASRDNDRRLVGSVINLRPPAQFAISTASYVATPQRFRHLPGSVYVQTREHTWYRPVPPGCNRVWARAHVRLYTLSDPIDVGFRCYTLPGFPYAKEPKQVQAQHFGSTVFLNTSHSTNDGAWVDLGSVVVQPDENGCVLFALAHVLDIGDPNVDDMHVSLRAMQVTPYYEPSDADGFDASP